VLAEHPLVVNDERIVDAPVVVLMLTTVSSMKTQAPSGLRLPV
jgi:hypothetical protein